MDFNTIPTTLDVSIYGAIEQINPVLSKSRVRIFYKGMNRNRTFISEDFANQLIASLPYTPVKGIFNKEDVDYEDHGEDNTDGRIYGIVPADVNFAWEDHLDEDGVTRTYACADVYLFTGLYPEAKLIPGESQSMEIFRGNLKGEWRVDPNDQKPYYHFLSGCLVGLQVLGQDVEPCFEGASFYSLNKDIQELVEYIKNFSKKEERVEMDKTLFRISDNEKADILFDLINPNFNEENNWQVDFFIMDVYEDYCLCASTKNREFKRFYYTKNGDEVSLGDSADVVIVDVTPTEYAALEAMKSIGDTFEAVTTSYNDMVNEVETLKMTISDYEAQIERFNTSEEAAEETAEENTEEVATENSVETETASEEPATEMEVNEETSEEVSEETPIVDNTAEFTEKINALEAEKVEMQRQLSDIKNENESLLAFKKAVEKTQKEEILTKYEQYLSDSVITEFKTNMDNFSVEDFKKEVCTMAVESDSTIFANKQNKPEIFYKGGIPDTDGNVSPVIRMLNNRKNGGNK